MSTSSQEIVAFTDEQLFADLTILNEVEVEASIIERAQNDDGEALYTIGELYYYKEDYSKSMAWFLKAASKENSNAQNRIGYQYHHGLGVTLNCALAMEWYLLADNNGNRNAPNNIGWLYHNGQGVNKDYKAALDWYVKSGAKGHKVAQCNIGISLERGRGVPVNKQLALEWYHRSADQGYQKAKDNIEKLNSAGFFLDVEQKATLGLEKRVTFLENQNEEYEKKMTDMHNDGIELKKKLKYMKYKYQENVKELEEKITVLDEENKAIEHKRREMESRLLILEQEVQKKHKLEKRMEALEDMILNLQLSNNNQGDHYNDLCYDSEIEDTNNDICYDGP